MSYCDECKNVKKKESEIICGLPFAFNGYFFLHSYDDWGGIWQSGFGGLDFLKNKNYEWDL